MLSAGLRPCTLCWPPAAVGSSLTGKPEAGREADCHNALLLAPILILLWTPRQREKTQGVLCA